MPTGDKEEKSRIRRSVQDTAKYLVSLGEALMDGKFGTEGGVISIDDVRKLKISLKYSPADENDPEGGFRIKTELVRKPEEVACPAEDTPKPGEAAEHVPAGKGDKAEYRRLKKKMKDEWRSIKSAGEGGIPDKGILDGFYAHSTKMLSFAGYGDEHYQAYRSAVEEMMGAAGNSDVSGFAAGAAKVEKIYRNCHDRYKNRR